MGSRFRIPNGSPGDRELPATCMGLLWAGGSVGISELSLPVRSAKYLSKSLLCQNEGSSNSNENGASGGVNVFDIPV